MEDVTLVPEMDFSEIDREYVSRTAYVMEHGVVPNRSYVIEGTAVPHPRSQSVVHFVPKIRYAQDSIADFSMDRKKRRMLRQFQPSRGQSVRRKFEEIAEDLTYNITRIYGREDIIMAIDLAFHSVLGFEFQGKPVAKAWADVLIIGDTRTGKTETAQSMIYHYKLGEMTVGENTSFAGLIGGLKQDVGKRWAITWGKIPLNNGRLLAIDEASGLPLETIAAMSGIRSNGIAEMTKIQQQRTMARTRLIWISNPRADKGMSQYAHGVEAVRDLFGRPEDIARLDFAISSATNEVPMGVINAETHKAVPHVYTSDLCRTMVLWAWSRSPDQISFEPDATRCVLDLATEQSERYSSAAGLPLVEGGNHRIKLAKMAAAAAARTFSTDDTGERVIVKPEHVEFVADFLDEIYDKASLDYSGWSRGMLTRTNVDPAKAKEAYDWVTAHPEWADLWLNKDELRLNDFITQFDLDAKDVRSSIFQPLAKLRMVEQGRQSAYVKTPAFIQILKEGLLPSNGAAPAEQPEGEEEEGDDVPF
jgi:MCM2/3/5 family protein